MDFAAAVGAAQADAAAPPPDKTSASGRWAIAYDEASETARAAREAFDQIFDRAYQQAYGRELDAKQVPHEVGHMMTQLTALKRACLRYQSAVDVRLWSMRA